MSSSPEIRLTACDQRGNPLAVPIPAGEDAISAEARIRAQGGRLQKIDVFEPARSRPKGISPEAFARFNEMLAASALRGVPMMHGIRMLASDLKKGPFRAAMHRIAEKLDRGISAQEAFAAEKDILPGLYGRLIEAGIESGDLPEVLTTLARNVRTDATFRQTVLESVVYPVFLLVVCVNLLGAFALNIFPRFAVPASYLHMQIPLLTRIMIAQNWIGQAFFCGVLCLFLCVVILYAFQLNGLRHRLVEGFLRRTPLFKSFYEAAVWSSTADTLALLLRAHVPAPHALRLLGPATGSRWLTAICEYLADQTECGVPLSIAARDNPAIPFRVAQTLSVGESRQDFVTALRDLAGRYRVESERRARLISHYLPQLLSVFMGLVVFLIALTMLWPYIKFWGASW